VRGADLYTSAERRKLLREASTWENPSSGATSDRRPPWRAAEARGSNGRKSLRFRLLWAVLIVALFAWTLPGVVPSIWRATRPRPEAPLLLGWTFTAARGSAGDRTSDTTIAMNPSANLVVGVIVIVVCASDNAASADGETTEHTVTDSQSNKWHKLREHCSAGGAGAAGVTGSVWACKVTTQIGTGDTITLTTSASQTAKCLCAVEVSSSAGAWDCIDVQVDAGTDNSPTAASLTIKSAAVLSIGAVCIESSDTAISAEDSDYTSRVWVRSGSSGGSTGNVSCGIATRIATLTSDTYAPTTGSSSNHVGFVVLLREAATKTRTRMVKSSGGAFTSLSSYESNQQADLTTIQEIRQAECWDFSDTTGVTVTGWTTSTTYYIRIYTPADERHDGTAGTGYRLEVSGSAGTYAITMQEDDLRLEGLEIARTGTEAGSIVATLSQGACANRISHCLLHDAAAQGITHIAGSGGNVKLWNTIIWGTGNHAIEAQTVDYNVYQVTICDCATNGGFTAFLRSGGTCTAKNCLVQNPNVAAGGANYGGTIGGTNNLAADTTAPGSNPQNSKTVTFVASGSNNFKLGSGDTVAKDQGADLSADATIAISDDIIGTARPQNGTYDIGASEVVAAASSILLFVACDTRNIDDMRGMRG
jgi:hypothetical protein